MPGMWEGEDFQHCGFRAVACIWLSQQKTSHNRMCQAHIYTAVTDVNSSYAEGLQNSQQQPPPMQPAAWHTAACEQDSAFVQLNWSQHWSYILSDPSTLLPLLGNAVSMQKLLPKRRVVFSTECLLLLWLIQGVVLCCHRAALEWKSMWALCSCFVHAWLFKTRIVLF